jgi:2-phosphoglycerate kinase
MTLEPAQNKYIRFFDNIRAIQSHVVSMAEEHMFPRIDNTNVDRSVSLMHSVIMKALRKVWTLAPFAHLNGHHARFYTCGHSWRTGHRWQSVV